MKSYRYNITKEEKQLTKIWDAFVDHIEAIYFPGASELLDRQTLTFEFDIFRTNYETA